MLLHIHAGALSRLTVPPNWLAYKIYSGHHCSALTLCYTCMVLHRHEMPFHLDDVQSQGRIQMTHTSVLVSFIQLVFVFFSLSGCTFYFNHV